MKDGGRSTFPFSFFSVSWAGAIFVAIFGAIFGTLSEPLFELVWGLIGLSVAEATSPSCSTLWTSVVFPGPSCEDRASPKPANV